MKFSGHKVKLLGAKFRSNLGPQLDSEPAVSHQCSMFDSPLIP
jgi:hypothetical protein